ncbi:glycosyltransferase family 4 protein [Brevundimonas sp. NIBR11]|uniref:glycosyltransferase family 4 protein n=1 Tax=Brevundimonas sp. NIBR11 TaxID=3015999 RepID=UPI0022F0DC3C|nr:glycosyltransferase family 4 protein [Brevundimonas sp. NIBR11]WGM31828.1 hypothetical protein KKHFBJBL_02077 [Brevundimonas sp. NIBR11]
MKVAIYERYRLRQGASGPPGYLWYLRCGLETLGDDSIVFLEGDTATAPNRPPPSRLMQRLRDVSPGLWRLAKSYGPSELRRQVIDATRNVAELRLPDWAEVELRDGDFDLIHCHCVEDAVRAHNSLECLGLRDRTRIITTVHSPEPPYLESLAGFHGHGLHRSLERTAERGLKTIDDTAVRVSDGFIFPAAEAIEHFASWSALTKALSEKPLRYVLTGITESAQTPSTYPLPAGRLKLMFAGRHNEVKGYDLLSSAAPLLERHDAVMVVAGAAGPLPTPEHPRWCELGWISNARSVMSRCDAFVLPNKATYFDLVALEVLAAGRMLIASRTGGNKVLERLSDGVLLFDPTEAGLRGALEEVAALDANELARRGASNRAAFDRHFTATRFAEKYLVAIRSLAAGASGAVDEPSDRNVSLCA